MERSTSSTTSPRATATTTTAGVTPTTTTAGAPPTTTTAGAPPTTTTTGVTAMAGADSHSSQKQLIFAPINAIFAQIRVCFCFTEPGLKSFSKLSNRRFF